MVEEVGKPRDFAAEGFEPRDHLELGELLGAIDMERGAKISGARFYFLKGVGALLQLGMLQLAIQQAVENGFTPMITPTLVKPEVMGGTGYLSAHDDVYRLADPDLYLVGTSEVSLAGYHMDEILDLHAAARSGTPAGRPATARRPGRTGRTPAGSSASTSSTRSRCSPTAAWRTRPRSTCGCSPGRRRCSTRWSCPTG